MRGGGGKDGGKGDGDKGGGNNDGKGSCDGGTTVAQTSKSLVVEEPLLNQDIVSPAANNSFSGLEVSLYFVLRMTSLSQHSSVSKLAEATIKPRSVRTVYDSRLP